MELNIVSSKIENFTFVSFPPPQKKKGCYLMLLRGSPLLPPAHLLLQYHVVQGRQAQAGPQHVFYACALPR